MAELRLDDQVQGWIESATRSRLIHANRIPGGGTREGWFVDVESEAGTQNLFLRYSPVALPEKTGFHSLATEAEVVRALRPTDVPVAAIVAIHPEREAVLMERVAGDTWFSRIKNPDEQVRVAQDFIRSLAAQHRLDPQDLGISALGPVKTAREHALERIAHIRWRGTSDGAIDPLLRVTLDWLEANVPDYEAPVVLVQGDTGPGNFLHRDGHVTAVLDWELCHFGDPMDDIAWLSLRTVQDTFTHLPDRLREYENLSGHTIDEERIWYYRVFAEATMTTLNPPHEETPGETATRDIGNVMIYHQLHRRLWLEALNEAMKLGLQRPQIPVPPEPTEWHGWYDSVLASLRTITPRITDPLASQWTRGVARAVKYLQELDVAGRQYADLELMEIAELIGTQPESLVAGRTALAEANRHGKISDADYVRFMWNKVLRDNEVMRSASGALHDRTWPPLV